MDLTKIENSQETVDLFAIPDITRAVLQEGKTIPPADRLIYNGYPNYWNLADNPDIQELQRTVKKSNYAVGDLTAKMITPFTAQAVLRHEWDIIQCWLIAFGLNRLTVNWGAYYIAEINREGAAYSDPQNQILKIIQRIIPLRELSKPDLYGKQDQPLREDVRKLAQDLRIWIPRTIRETHYLWT